MRYVRKDGRRQIEEDEKDNLSDFICLIYKDDACMEIDVKQMEG
jgi:hypothetical protein